MGLGTSLFLIAVGAILRFAVHVSAHGIDLHTIGLILMVVGVIGLVITLLWMTIWADRSGRESRVVDREIPPTRRY